jgi:pimeloyl-ACP methyl ester carboxylesterase
VFLIHGLWGSPDDWSNFSALISDARFDHTAADYHTTAGDSVSSNEPSVLSQLRAWLWSYELTHGIAAIQADVVAHSMGGLIARDMLLDPSVAFASSNRFQGIIHKMITIDTPHNGSQFAARLEVSPCHFIFGFYNRPVAGAVADLVPGSALLTSLEEAPFQAKYAHALVGIASLDQQSAAINGNTAWDLWAACPDMLNGGFQAVFNGDGNDLVVSESSQQFGFAVAGVTESQNVIHSVDSGLFPLGPDALDQVLSGSAKIPSSTLTNSTVVVTLLNTFITNAAFVEIEP